jgi:hypothetical protein
MTEGSSAVKHVVLAHGAVNDVDEELEKLGA